MNEQMLSNSAMYVWNERCSLHYIYTSLVFHLIPLNYNCLYISHVHVIIVI